ncbi:hypothetical protein TRIATDRAFT_258934 [Trichoderma atroviride IMI 206040]|uniref:Uncharacterized protein n=1 Tax=Hypocrea atroviridis (strain ATCC 20476 / IMI 206040) TaxID=452589 RepID=G9P7T3_HYPAI|nr:uncharacterized protein TRIATDRAFT_301603 [Trichoderma atroviride IMI 206040]EHK40835.1 hypothetical protein TRIATDRAFT_258934 [Trichoderma atroviride IMI 206040]
MVGRELPNLRPNGEDHRGAGGGIQVEMLRTTMKESRSWPRMTMMRMDKGQGTEKVASCVAISGDTSREMKRIARLAIAMTKTIRTTSKMKKMSGKRPWWKRRSIESTRHKPKGGQTSGLAKKRSKPSNEGNSAWRRRSEEIAGVAKSAWPYRFLSLGQWLDWEVLNPVPIRYQDSPREARRMTRFLLRWDTFPLHPVHALGQSLQFLHRGQPASMRSLPGTPSSTKQLALAPLQMLLPSVMALDSLI